MVAGIAVMTGDVTATVTTETAALAEPLDLAEGSSEYSQHVVVFRCAAAAPTTQPQLSGSGHTFAQRTGGSRFVTKVPFQEELSLEA